MPAGNTTLVGFLCALGDLLALRRVSNEENRTDDSDRKNGDVA